MRRKIVNNLWLKAKALCLAAAMTVSSFSMTQPLYAEEYNEEEEEEYIPETYYDPIQTNDLSGWPQGQAIQAAAGIVMDLDTNAIVYGKNIYDKHYPASITKIMTTMVALDRTDDLDEKFVCGEEVYAIEENSSNLGIQPGEEVTMRQALYGLMLESANDLGNAIAVHIAGSVSAYAELMNEKAAKIGCVNTHFTNPHGLHSEEHYTCAYDMALIAQAAYKKKAFRKICSTTEYTIPATNIVDEDRSFANHQRLLQSYSDYYQPWCTGGKTGFTSDAWNTLVTYAEQDGKRYVCVILRENGLDHSYQETTDLINYAFHNFEHKEVTEGKAPVTFGELLKLNYPNEGTTVYSSDVLDEVTIADERAGLVTVPVGTDVLSLGRKNVEGASGTFIYTYDGWEVGSGSITFAPMPKASDISFPYQKELNMEELFEKSKSGRQLRELQQTAKTAWNNITTTTVDVYEQASVYVDENRMTVLLVGLIITAVLILLIIILILRCTRESRRARKKKAQERQIRRAEEEIDRKSAIEIEEELRRAMEEERRKQEEKQRIEEQRRIEEEKLLEAERFLEQIRNEHNDTSK